MMIINDTILIYGVYDHNDRTHINHNISFTMIMPIMNTYDNDDRYNDNKWFVV